MATVAQYRIELSSIKALNLLFHNYKTKDIDYLRKNREFAHVWAEYWDGYQRTVTVEQFWGMWADKFSYSTQAYILDFAMERFGEEAYGTGHPAWY